MLTAAADALAQMFSPPFRAVLVKSVGLALLLIVAMGVALQRLLSWAASGGSAWAEHALGGYHTLIAGLQVVLTVLASFGIVVGAIFLMPAVSALVASFFADDIAALVERRHYPADPPGTPLPAGRALTEGVKTALLSLVVYLFALPMLLLGGLGALAFFFATAFLLSREYFLLAAMRFRPREEARMLRRRHAGAILLAGLLIAAFVSIPIVNLATPLFATALMVHTYKRLSESDRRREFRLAGGGRN
jgi:uncharacterized protein involved in cysteine biosynthesis